MKFAGVNLDSGVLCPMRDGVRLACDVYRPDALDEAPVLLMRQPYGRAIASTVTYAHPAWYARRGFVVVVQDVRGRGDSEGVFDPFIQEMDDGYDAVEWGARLPGANGQVAMYGFSYQGYTQLAAAAAAPPSLRAITPAMCAADLYGGWFYPFGRFALGGQLPWAAQLARDEARRAGDGGAEEVLTAVMSDPASVLWRLPLLAAPPEELLRYAPFYRDWVGHPLRDGYWAERDLTARLEGACVPALHIAGWHDPFLRGSLATFARLHAADAERHALLVAPFAHIPWGRFAGGWDHGPEAAGFVDDFQVAWLRRALGSAAAGEEAPAALDEDEPAVLYFEMGSGNWERAQAWPPVDGVELLELFLASGGGLANSAHGTGRLGSRQRGLRQLDSGQGGDGRADAPDVYVYDARLPMPLAGLTPEDRSRIQERNEILVYTGEPLQAPLRLAGPPRLEVWCAARGGPTDVVALLSVVVPSNEARFLTVGRATVGEAGGETAGGETVGGEVVGRAVGRSAEYQRVELALLDVAVEIPAGAAIRLELTGSAFPFIARHPNGLKDAASVLRSDSGALRVAAVAVAHDDRRPSRVMLPVRSANFGE